MPYCRWLSVAAICVAFVSPPLLTGHAQEKSVPTGVAGKSSGAIAPNPVARPDRAPISLTGTVTSTTAETFVLDYGTGTVTVEMDDWEIFDKAHEIVAGHKVTVFGRIDHDLFMERRIEASMVFDHDRKRYFYANAADEEIAHGPFPFGMLAGKAPSAGIAGTVRSIADRSFSLDVGSSSIRVDTGGMAFNPMVGRDALESGDRVVVYGTLDDAGFFDRREIQATSILILGSDGPSLTEDPPPGGREDNAP